MERRLKLFLILLVTAGREVYLAKKFGGYCPMMTEFRLPKNRKSIKPVAFETPRFPSYIFVKDGDYQTLNAALKHKNVYCTVKSSGKYAKVNDFEITHQKGEDQITYKIGDKIPFTIGGVELIGSYIGRGKIKLSLSCGDITVAI